MSGLTLQHTETEVEPECTVVLGANRLVDGEWKDCRVEVKFVLCHYARLGRNSDSETLESMGYRFEFGFDVPAKDYQEWHSRTWQATGNCPSPSFYVATQSAWLNSLPERCRIGRRHYVLVGVDGYVELIAERFAWRAWEWKLGHREDALNGPVIASGNGTE